MTIWLLLSQPVNVVRWWVDPGDGETLKTCWCEYWEKADVGTSVLLLRGVCGCTALDFSREPLFGITRAEACSEGRHSCGTNTFGFIELPSSCNGNHPRHRRWNLVSPLFLVLFFFTLIYFWEGWDFFSGFTDCYLLVETSDVPGNQWWPLVYLIAVCGAPCRTVHCFAAGLSWEMIGVHERRLSGNLSD